MVSRAFRRSAPRTGHTASMFSLKLLTVREGERLLHQRRLLHAIAEVARLGRDGMRTPGRDHHHARPHTTSSIRRRVRQGLGREPEGRVLLRPVRRRDPCEGMRANFAHSLETRRIAPLGREQFR